MDRFITIPDVEINTLMPDQGEVLKVGPATFRILEDGSHTDNRLGVGEVILPPKFFGPPPHWHEMHDETFYVTKGTVRFHVPDPHNEGKDKRVVDATAGAYAVVPIRAPHTFSNPTNEEARMFFTSTPAFYIRYLRLIANMTEPDVPLPAEVILKAMSIYATIQADNKPRIS